MGESAGGVRARRSVLAVPGSSPRMLAKAPSLAADQVFLDLEDAVAPGAKEEARGFVVRALVEAEWPASTLVAVRVNASGTPWHDEDVRVILSEGGSRLDALIVPKVETPEAVVALDRAIADLRPETDLEVQVESALGLVNVEAIAAASPRLRALHFGPADMSASLGMPALTAGAAPAGYPGDHWHAVLVRILVAARANGLDALDGPHLAIEDLEGLRASARRARALGYDGKWAIHPSQLEVINEAFSPTDQELERARAIVDALDQAAGQGTGAVRFGAEMLDEANRRMAERVLARARASGMG